MKTSLHGTTLALAWSQCLGSQTTSQPPSQPTHEHWWRKEEGAVNKNSGVVAEHPARVATSGAKARR